MAAYDDDYDDDFPDDVGDQKRRHAFDALGELFALIDGVLDTGHANGEQPIEPVPVPGGTGLYELCAPRLFAVYVVLAATFGQTRPVMKVLAVHHDRATARAMAKSRL